ncbi:MAG: VPLPA-CTERM sorting domain-containing protein, partial [Methylococcales bacterium]
SDGTGDGWADGTLNTRDSFGAWEFTAGTYILAFGDYNLQAADPIAGFNTGDSLGSSQTHTDYQIRFTADVPFTVTPTAVPLPAAVWLFGSAVTGMGLFGRKKKA